MGLFDHFPYTNVHELNLDWVLSMMKALEAEWESFTAGNSLTFADPMLHDITKTYAKNTIVIDAAVGIALGNQSYWLMVFDYEAFIEKVNKNFTARYYRGQYRATAAMAIGDWLTVDDVLCKATAAIAIDDVLEDGVNITHFTLEDFIKSFMQSATQLINQYKNDIDASELLYRQQLAQDITNTVSTLQAQLDAAISGATVDSEVINARVGSDGVTYPTLGDAIRTQIENVDTLIGDEITYNENNTAALIDRLNLVNPSDIASGYYDNTGTYHASGTYYYAFVRVKPGHSYYFASANLYLGFYDITKKFVSYFDNSGYVFGTPITIPSGCYYAVITTSTPSTTYVSEYVNTYKDYSTLITVVNSSLGQYAPVLYENNYIFEQIRYNLVDPSTLIQGFYNASGVHVNNPNFKCAKVPVKPSTTYYFERADLFLTWYDINGNFISVYDNSGYTSGDPITTPATCYYAGITANAGDNAVFVSPVEFKYYPYQYIKAEHLANTYPDSEFIRKSDLDLRTNKLNFAISKLLCIGDSLTAGAYFKTPAPAGMNVGDSIAQNYPYYLWRMLCMNDVANGGVSGISMAQWYTSEYGNYNMADYDSFIIWLGTNGGIEGDLATDVNPYNDYNDYATTGVGYYCKLIEHIKADNPSCFIVLINLYAVSPGHTLSDSNDNIAAIAAKYSIPLIDATDMDYSTNPVAHGNYNNIHLTKAGNLMMAQKIYDYLNSYFKNDPTKTEFGLTPAE